MLLLLPRLEVWLRRRRHFLLDESGVGLRSHARWRSVIAEGLLDLLDLIEFFLHILHLPLHVPAELAVELSRLSAYLVALFEAQLGWLSFQVSEILIRLEGTNKSSEDEGKRCYHSSVYQRTSGHAPPHIVVLLAFPVTFASASSSTTLVTTILFIGPHAAVSDFFIKFIIEFVQVKIFNLFTTKVSSMVLLKCGLWDVIQVDFIKRSL